MDATEDVDAAQADAATRQRLLALLHRDVRAVTEQLPAQDAAASNLPINRASVAVVSQVTMAFLGSCATCSRRISAAFAKVVFFCDKKII